MKLVSIQNSVPNVAHFIIAFYFAFAFLAARFLLDRIIFRKLSILFLSGRSTRLKLNEATMAKVAKCSESMRKFTYYATIECCVLAATHNDPWFKDMKQYFIGWPHHELKLSLKLIYMCQSGFYIYSSVSLITWETPRKDFSVMMSHHIISVILIFCSYMSGFFRIGAVTFALHDASDVFMEAAKVFKYSGNEVGASVCFVLFAVSWLVLRLVLYPFMGHRIVSVLYVRSVDPIKDEPYSDTLCHTHYVIDSACFSCILVGSHMLDDQRTAEKQRKRWGRCTIRFRPRIV